MERVGKGMGERRNKGARGRREARDQLRERRGQADPFIEPGLPGYS